MAELERTFITENPYEEELKNETDLEVICNVYDFVESRQMQAVLYGTTGKAKEEENPKDRLPTAQDQLRQMLKGLDFDDDE